MTTTNPYRKYLGQAEHDAIFYVQADARNEWYHGAAEPQKAAPRQPNEERLSRILVHHIQQATTGGAARRY